MRPALPVLLAVCGLAGAAAAEEVPSIKAPATTIAGLAFDGKRLWCADRASRTLFAVDPATGEVVKRLR